MPPDPPDLSDHGLLAKLRRALDANGYTSENVDALMASDATNAFLDGWNNPVLRRTDLETPLATLSRLFALGLEVPAQDLDDVRGASLSDWEDAGLVATRRRTAQPLVAIRPLRMWGTDTHVLCDTMQPGLGRAPFADFVRGVTPASSQLGKITLRRKFARALDMGTGDGIQALLASSHCEEVVATDVNPRAVAFTRFNMVWSDVANVEVRLGDRYEPVEGEEFDLIVSNPPWVVSPAMAASFRDSGMPTDTMSATAVQGAAEHLAPSGWAFLLCQWVHVEGEQWQDRVGSWAAGTTCDAWAVQQHFVDPVSHAIEWLNELGRVAPEDADREFDQWMRYFDDEGIVGVGTGFVVLRRTAGSAPWYCADERGDDVAAESGETIAALFEAKGWLNSHPEAGAVLDGRWRLAEHVRLQTTSTTKDECWVATDRVLRLEAGLRTAIPVTEQLSQLLVACDGSRPLRSILDSQLQGSGRDSSWYEVPVETAFRKLIGAGFVVPVAEGTR